MNNRWRALARAILIRQTVLERIEDEYDLKAYEKAMAEYQANPVAYPHDEVRVSTADLSEYDHAEDD